jgi:hypothetical protein
MCRWPIKIKPIGGKGYCKELKKTELFYFRAKKKTSY